MAVNRRVSFADQQEEIAGPGRKASFQAMRNSFYNFLSSSGPRRVKQSLSHWNRFETVSFPSEETKDWAHMEAKSSSSSFVATVLNLMTWILPGLIGFLTASTGVLIEKASEHLNALLFGRCSSDVFAGGPHGCPSTWSPWSGDLHVPGEQSWGSYFRGWAAYVAFAALFGGISATLVRLFAPAARGSGIPEVKTLLGGFRMPEVLSLKTLVVKVVGLAFSVSSGMSLGKEGPLVHVACCWANLCSKFSTRYMDNEGKRRELISTAAAAGVAVAFGAPVGGVLFSYEEVSTMFPQRTMIRAFFASVVAALTLVWYNPTGTGKLTMFEAYVPNMPSAYELPWFLLLGVVGGLLGALFVHWNIKISVARADGTRFRRAVPVVVEVVGIALLTGITSYPLPYTRVLSSVTIRELFQSCDTLAVDRIDAGLCDESMPVMTQSLVLALLVSAMVRFLQMTITFGTGVPCGLFVPSLYTGACLGRCMGIFVWWLHASLGFETSGIHPGVYAMIGAAAMLGGVCRVTISLVVIMYELTSALQLIVPFMLAVLTAKWVGDLLTHGIYDDCIRVRGYPYLHEPDDFSFGARACDIMDEELECLFAEAGPIGDLLRKVSTTKFGGFPLVKSRTDRALLGYVHVQQLRRHLETLLASGLNHESQPAVFKRYMTQGQVGGVDLSRFVDDSIMRIVPETPIAQVHSIFRQLGVKVLLVTRFAELAGLITKKSFVHHLEQQHGTPGHSASIVSAVQSRPGSVITSAAIDEERAADLEDPKPVAKLFTDTSSISGQTLLSIEKPVRGQTASKDQLPVLIRGDPGQKSKLATAQAEERRGSLTSERRGSYTSEDPVERRGSLTSERRGSLTSERRTSPTSERRGSLTSERRSSLTAMREKFARAFSSASLASGASDVPPTSGTVSKYCTPTTKFKTATENGAMQPRVKKSLQKWGNFATVSIPTEDAKDATEHVSVALSSGSTFAQRKLSLLPWLIPALVGFLTATSGSVVEVAAEYLNSLRFGSCTTNIFLRQEHCGDAWRGWSDRDGFAVALLGAEQHAFVMYVLVSVAFAAFSATLVWLFAPTARGSGIPEVKTILGGFSMPDVLEFKTLIVKLVGLAFSVSSGMSLGKEGPLVHVACCWANWCSKLSARYHGNEAKRRELISTAAAAGVSVAFGTPLGGVLFSYEEVSSMFPQKTMIRAFFAAVVAALTLAWYDPTGTGKLTMFETHYREMPAIAEFPFFLLLGAIGGALGAVFVHFNIMVSSRRAEGSAFRARVPVVVEVAVIALVTAVTSYPSRYTRDLSVKTIRALFRSCHTAADEGFDMMGLCEGESPAEGFELMLSLSVAAVLRLVQCIFTFGTGVPCGLFVPSLFTGACLGRIVGLLVMTLNGSYHFVPSPINPGIYAMVGAAAMLGGVCRVTISLVVIMFGLTGGLQLILPFMLAVLTAKFVGDVFTEGIYDACIVLRGYPYLHEPHDADFKRRACDLMDCELECLNAEPGTLQQVLSILRRTTFGGFPLVVSPSDSTLLGYVHAEPLRKYLETMLKTSSIVKPDLPVAFRKYTTKKAAGALDISRFVDETIVRIVPETSLAHVHSIFRQLGVKLVLVSRFGHLAGLITKKALVDHLQEEHGGHHRAEQEQPVAVQRGLSRGLSRLSASQPGSSLTAPLLSS